MADKLPFNGPVEFNSTVTSTGTGTHSGANTFTGAVHMYERVAEPLFTSSTAHTAGATLVKNTLNVINHSAAEDLVFALPSAASSTKGDIVRVAYVNTIANTQTHKFTTDGASFSAVSGLFVATSAANGSVFAAVAAPNGETNDTLTLTGGTNAGVGPGTDLLFVFEGTLWQVSGKVYNSGDGSGGNAQAAFGDS